MEKETFSFNKDVFYIYIYMEKLEMVAENVSKHDTTADLVTSKDAISFNRRVTMLRALTLPEDHHESN